MVASIAPMSKGIETYYTELAREDYYLEGGEPPGMWLGTAAEKLGLTGEVQKEDLSRLLAGFGRENDKLVRNAGSENRQVGWDMTFSAPKDVSIVWGIGSDAQRNAIEEAHNKAVEVAIEYLQKEAMWSRTGQAGKDWKSAGSGRWHVPSWDKPRCRSESSYTCPFCKRWTTRRRENGNYR